MPQHGPALAMSDRFGNFAGRRRPPAVAERPRGRLARRSYPLETFPKAMIKGVHTMFYSSKADELRAFLRDKLGLPATDVGDGWLIFALPEADMGCHPADATGVNGDPSGTHAISFYCDDIHKTVEELTAKGVEFTREITNTGWGLVTAFKVPGDFEIDLYQPLYGKG